MCARSGRKALTRRPARSRQSVVLLVVPRLVVPVIQPGTLYEKRQTQLDLRVTKRMTVRKARILGSVDVFNLLNSTVASGYANGIPGGGAGRTMRCTVSTPPTIVSAACDCGPRLPMCFLPVRSHSRTGSSFSEL